MQVLGIDEVGRGCWAGPLVAAAVILSSPIKGLTDSKLLTKGQREELSEAILKSCEVSLGWVSASKIDQIGLTAATRAAMKAAVEGIKSKYDEIIIDGKLNFLADNPKSVAIIKADITVPCVSAASIVAKVARDSYMNTIAQQYPVYGFDKHVGYGTRQHHTMLKLHGPCDLHRFSYKPIQSLLVKNV